jgi:hypothetical protein
MEGKIYILMTSSGAYDDYMTHILGIYSTQELAEEGKVKYKEALDKFFADNPCPVDEETKEKLDSYDIMLDDLDDSLADLYQDWFIKTGGVYSMCESSWIVEKILNETDTGLIDDRTVYF